MENNNEVRKLTIDLATKSYQIFLAAVIVTPWVTGHFNPMILGSGLVLCLISLTIAYYSALRIKKEAKV